MNHCKTCVYWIGEAPKYLQPGYRYCKHHKLVEEYADQFPNKDALVYSYMEGGSFYAGENFGCVHHKERGNG